MKCPKCGYISFDYLDTCGRCKTRLDGVRQLLGLVAVPAGDKAVVLQSSGLGGLAEAQEDYDFEFSEEEAASGEEFEFESGPVEEEPLSPVGDLEDLGMEEEGIPSLDLPDQPQDLEEIHLELSEMEGEAFFDPELDLKAQEDLGDMEQELEIPLDQPSPTAAGLVSEEELEIMGATPGFAGPTPEREPPAPLDVEEELSLDLNQEVQIPDVPMEQAAAGEVDTGAEEEPVSPGMLDLSDLEEGLSELEEPGAAAPRQEQEDLVFELAEEEGEEEELSLEELSKDEIFQPLEGEEWPEQGLSPEEGGQEDIPAVDLDEAEDADLEELALELEGSLEALEQESAPGASDREILEAIPDDSETESR